MSSSEIKNLADSILEILVKTSDKFVRKNHTELHVLSALQIASGNFLGSVVMANARMLTDKSHKLDFLDTVKADIDNIFEQMRAMMKSVDLH